ncbi:hypothetical protein ACHAPT_007231 [Fusarium lateritium]
MELKGRHLPRTDTSATELKSPVACGRFVGPPEEELFICHGRSMHAIGDLCMEARRKRGVASKEGRSELECFGTLRGPLTMSASEPQSTTGLDVHGG